MRTHLLIPDTTATLFVTLLWGKTFQLEQHCLIKEVHALSSFIAEDAIFDFFSWALGVTIMYWLF